MDDFLVEMYKFADDRQYQMYNMGSIDFAQQIK
jgi:hypothetical protein